MIVNIRYLNQDRFTGNINYMQLLEKYDLEFTKTHDYLLKRLKNINALSKAVIQFTPFEKGNFSTILKKNLSQEMVYDFQNIHVAEGVKEEIAATLYKEMQYSDQNICIFDDFNEEYESGNNWALFNDIGVHFNREMYYAVTSDENGKDILLQCLQASNATWHGLCILSNGPYQRNKDQSITSKELQLLSQTTKLLLLVAYDAESYIIWKKNSV